MKTGIKSEKALARMNRWIVNDVGMQNLKKTKEKTEREGERMEDELLRKGL